MPDIPRAPSQPGRHHRLGKSCSPRTCRSARIAREGSPLADKVLDEGSGSQRDRARAGTFATENGRARDPHGIDDDPTLRLRTAEPAGGQGRIVSRPTSGTRGGRRSPGARATGRPGAGARLFAFFGSIWQPALVLVAVLAIWWVVAWRELVAKYLVPSPGEVF